MTAQRLLFSLIFVFTGLAGRALLDKLLSIQGGAVAVAAWAQLANVADVVAGVSLTGVGTALTVLSAGKPGRHPGLWLKPALLLGLALSLLVAALGVPLLLSLEQPLLPGGNALSLFALLAGWLSVAPGLLVALFLGLGSPGRASAVLAAGFILPLAGLYWGPAASPLANLLAGQAAFGLAVLAGLAFYLAGREPISRQEIQTLLKFVPAGLAIGILSPLTTTWARLEIATGLSWHEAGQVQALWRCSEWITAVMAGLLNAYYLPRLGERARDRAAFLAELGRAAKATLLPAALLLALLWLLLPAVMPLLYQTGMEVGREDALFFLMGDWIRIISWIFLFGLFARRAAWAITVGEFLSLPLFALFLALLAERLDLGQVGLVWLATYGVYAAFNGAALGWSLRRE